MQEKTESTGSSAPGILGALTRRDYFALHAPQIPQPWFKPKCLPVHPNAYRAPDGAGGFLVPAMKQELDDWNEEYQRQLLIQWPWAWADQVMHSGDRKIW